MGRFWYSLILLISFNTLASEEVPRHPKKTPARLTQINQFQMQSLQRGDLAVLVWNIYGGSKQGFQADSNHLLANTDIAIFQEANLSSSLLTFFQQTDLAWQHAKSFQWRQTKMGVSIGSQAKPNKVTPLLSKNKELSFTTRKTNLIHTYSIQGHPQSLMVFNTHTINFQTTAVFKEEIDQMIEAMLSHKGPLIFAGDFNTWNKGRYLYLMQKVHELKLKTIVFAKKRTTSPLDKSLPLDHIFYRDLKLKQAEVLDHISSSDHLPMKAIFEL